MEAQWPSFTALDRRISSLFFSWGVFNVFLGAMLVHKHLKKQSAFHALNLAAPLVLPQPYVWPYVLHAWGPPPRGDCAADQKDTLGHAHGLVAAYLGSRCCSLKCE